MRRQEDPIYRATGAQSDGHERHAFVARVSANSHVSWPARPLTAMFLVPTRRPWLVLLDERRLKKSLLNMSNGVTRW